MSVERNDDGRVIFLRRLELVERRYRRLRAMGGVCVLLLACGLLMGQATPRRTIEAEEVVIRDINGNVRIRIGHQLRPDGTLDDQGITLFNSKGQLCASLSSPSVLPQPFEDIRVPVILIPDIVNPASSTDGMSISSAGVTATLDSGRAHAGLSVSTSTTGSSSNLALYSNGPMGDGGVSLASWKDGAATMALSGAERSRILFTFADSTYPRVSLLDAQGNPRAVLGTSCLETIRTGGSETTSPSSLVLFDKDGRVLFRAPQGQ